MSGSVRRAIVEAIQARGPISFAEFMDMSLYGPDGYYAAPPVGEDGDFVTSPHVHPIFGRLLARALRQLHDTMDGPLPWRIVDAGAGDGTLARQLIEAVGEPAPHYVALERSPGAARALAEVNEIDGVEAALAETDDPQVILAHELLDNLAFRRVVGTSQGPREILIGVGGNGALIEAASETDVATRTAPLLPGDEVVVPEGALAFVDQIGRVLRRGYALIIDYGTTGSAGGPVHGYRDHRVVADLLSDPGSTDITAGVDFDAVTRRAVERGLVAFPSVTQRGALMALGFEDWVRDEQHRQRELLDTRRGAEAVRAWSARSRATLLVDPAGLGRFRWLLLASPGLEAPAWLTAALASEA
jgi:SAM-dependent MidA family methyltransferase